MLIEAGANSQQVLKDSYEALEDDGGITFATVQVENEYVEIAGSEDIDITGEHRAGLMPEHEHEAAVSQDEGHHEM